MSQSKISWGCCGAETDDDEYVVCAVCNSAFHLACLSYNNTDITSLQSTSTWTCPSCDRDKPKQRSSKNPPMRPNSFVTTRPIKRTALNSPPGVAVEPISKDDVRDIVQEVVKKEISGLMSLIGDNIKNVISNELAPFKKEMQDMQASMTFMSNQYEDLISHQKTSNEAMKKIQTENDKLHLTIRDLNSRLCLLEQIGRANNLEIQCVPENKNENVIEVVKSISKAVGCTITNENISNCSRTAKLNTTSSRPRSIVVRFNTQIVRDELLASVIKFNKANPTNKLNSSHIGYADKTPIYVIEHLSASNKALHAAARIKAKEAGFKYVWIRGGRIYMRKDDTSEYKWIKDMDSLSKIM